MVIKITTNQELNMILEKGKVPEWQVVDKKVSAKLSGEFLKESQKKS